MASFCVNRETCPTCGAIGLCKRHSYYKRYIIDYLDGHPKVIQIKILRVICTGCGKTHAILADPIVPYDSHSLLFILRVLAEYYLHTKTIAEICKTYAISISTFYRWHKLFKEHREHWQGLLVSMESSLKTSLHTLVNIYPFSRFASDFYRSTGISFMQSHQNPASNRRSAPPGKNVFT